MDELKGIGAGWIAIHPYARIGKDGGVGFREDREPTYITQPLAWAKERGMSVMLVPHIAYWGSPFKWRGEINFDSDEKWDRFFRDYERWIVRMAELAEAGGAPLFCIGLEYTHAQRFDARWRQIIRSVRAVYRGKVTYGSNWDQVEAVPFWDAVDLIGVLAYFPLSEEPNPSEQQLDAAWRKWLKQLNAFARRKDRRFIFTEVGYDESMSCALRPWEDGRQRGRDAAALQARCLDRALALQNAGVSMFGGMFLWKWFPDMPSRHRETFDLRTPTLKATIAQRWR
jgi:hypothetical protein